MSERPRARRDVGRPARHHAGGGASARRPSCSACAGTLIELGSQQDRNYRIDAADGRLRAQGREPGLVRPRARGVRARRSPTSRAAGLDVPEPLQRARRIADRLARDARRTTRPASAHLSRGHAAERGRLPRARRRPDARHARRRDLARARRLRRTRASRYRCSGICVTPGRSSRASPRTSRTRRRARASSGSRGRCDRPAGAAAGGPARAGRARRPDGRQRRLPPRARTAACCRTGSSTSATSCAAGSSASSRSPAPPRSRTCRAARSGSCRRCRRSTSSCRSPTRRSRALWPLDRPARRVARRLGRAAARDRPGERSTPPSARTSAGSMLEGVGRARLRARRGGPPRGARTTADASPSLAVSRPLIRGLRRSRAASWTSRVTSARARRAAASSSPAASRRCSSARPPPDGVAIARYGEHRLTRSRPALRSRAGDVRTLRRARRRRGPGGRGAVARAASPRPGRPAPMLEHDGVALRLSGIASALRARQLARRAVRRSARSLRVHRMRVQLCTEPRRRAARVRDAVVSRRRGAGCAPTPPRSSAIDVRGARGSTRPAVLERRDAAYARVQGRYYEEPPQIERGLAEHLDRRERDAATSTWSTTSRCSATPIRR